MRHNFKRNKWGTKLFSILSLASALFIQGTPSTKAAEPVNWRFQLGGMSSILRYVPEDNFRARHISFLVGAEIQFPIKNKYYIETGVNFGVAPTTYTYSAYDKECVAEMIPLKDFDKSGNYIGSSDKYQTPRVIVSTTCYIDVPLRFGYKLIFNEKNQLQFGLGPMFRFNLSPEKNANPSGGGVSALKNVNCFSVGLSPSVVYKHRALSLGLFYNNPFIYNGSKNRETNTLIFTVGVNFNGRSINLDKLANGLSAAASALGTATEIMSTYNSGSGNSGSYNSDSYSPSSSSSSSRSSSASSGSKYSVSDKTHADRDRSTYFKYETIVQNILRGDDKTNKISDIQNKMRQLRQKWANTPYKWNKSAWE